jgi:hypothetical protein
MLKRTGIIMLLSLCFFSSVSAQRHELGFMIGVSDYNGELNPGFLNFKFLHPAGGLIYRFNKNKHFSYKLDALFGTVSADDALSNDAYQLNRNLSFSSGIQEVSGQIEFNFFPYEAGSDNTFFTPYMFAGISIFHFNPTAVLNGKTYDLEPLHTEMEPGYNRIVGAFPFGGGLKLSLGTVNIGVEVGVRKTYTDYLDDVSTTYPNAGTLLATNGPIAVLLSNRSLNSAGESIQGRQRGNPNNNDYYMFGGFWVTFTVFNVGKHSCEAFPKWRY